MGWLPVSLVDIDAGQSSKEFVNNVPTIPAQGLTRTSFSTDRDTSNFIYNVFVPFLIISVIIAVIGFFYRQSINSSGISGNNPDYGVPHAKFSKTESGFSVNFIRSSKIFYIITHAASSIKSPNGLAAFFFLLLMIVTMGFIIFWYGIESFFKTVISVDEEFIDINGNRMSKVDFGNFHVFESLTGNSGEAAILGYNYGQRSFPFGGVWEKGRAQEVASALNSHLRSSKRKGLAPKAMPEESRQNYQSDF